jgi:hypothetical protein
MLTRLKGARPSPALVISLIALFVSLGGAGYAAVTVTGKNVKNSSLTGKDVKNSSLTGKDVKNSSLTGSDVKNSSLGGTDIKNDNVTGSDVNEASLGKVPAASSADNANTVGGQSAAQLGLKAYGHVNSDGTLEASRSKGIVSVANATFPNTHCFELGFTPKIVLATVEEASTGKIATSSPTGFGCPASTDAVVYTVNAAGDAETVAFDVLFE